MYSTAQQNEFFKLSKTYTQAGSKERKQPAATQLQQLRDLIRYHEWRYYVQNDPIISDYEYDSLFKLLESLEAANPLFITPDSPTQRVSDDMTSDFETVRHLRPMLSLANSYNLEDLVEFDKQIKSLLKIEETEDIEYIVEPKFDGGSIGLVYENNQLVRAATRGNGQEGDNITNNAKAIKSIPLRADFASKGIFQAEIRGEALIRKDNFEKINQERVKSGQSIFANPRNAATGALRMKNPQEVADRQLDAFLYSLGVALDKDGNDMIAQTFPSHKASLDFMASIGFKIPTNESKVCKNIQEVNRFCEAWAAKRETYAYEIDGMVIKVNDRELQVRAGHTSHHPRWAIAYKFQAKQATTILEKVEYQVGKIGTITPVAKVTPVSLAGVTISSISLHNSDFIIEKDIRLGDKVLIERAGDVIPYIVKSLADLRDGSEQIITYPEFCPINDTGQPIKLVRQEGEAAWRCPTCVCGAQDLQRLIFHVSKDAMNIDGMGKSIVEKFFELGWIRTYADIYRLDYKKISQLEGFGDKSAKNLETSINKAKNNPIHRLLYSLTIHHFGKKVSKLIAAEIKSVFDLCNWQLEDFTNIKDIGPVVAENIVEYFSNPKNIEILREMEALGVNMKQLESDLPIQAKETGPLVGKSILFTGSLQQLSRREAQQKAEAAGAKNVSSVSKKLNILVIGEKPGSKKKKALELGTVEILSEEQFLALLEE